MVNMYRGIPFSPQAALVDKIGESDTIIKVTDISAFPDAPNYATIGTDEGGETILYAAKTADSLSGCVRGVEGSAKSWSAGTTIARNFTSKDMEALQDNIKSAKTAADNAQTTADNAKTTADNAKTTADNAKTTADNAKTTADNAIPKSGGDLTGTLRMNGNIISGLSNPTKKDHAANKEYVDASSRGAAPRNLLDNSDFTNLVAQAGVGGSHGNQKYAADRWILTSGTVSYSAEKGLTLNGTITQKLERTPGAASAFVGTASGTAKISYANGAVTITSSGGILKWAALYEGEYTDDTMPVYRSKGYGAELAECQRYYVRIVDSSGPPQGFGFAVSSTNIRIMVPLNVQMRNVPTVTIFGDYTVQKIRLFSSNGECNPTDIMHVSIFNCGIHFQFVVSNASPNIPYIMRSMNLECSADL